MKVRRKRSKIWLIPKDEFQKIISESTTYLEVINKLGFSPGSGSGNYKTILARVKVDELDTSSIKRTVVTRRNPAIPLSDILVAQSSYLNGSSLKRRLFDSKLLKNECYLCGLSSLWNGKPLVLQLDHINGTHNDNRIENLRILCPNCHTQTSTFTGRKNKNRKTCFDCGDAIRKKNVRCRKCENQRKIGLNTKINWPSPEELTRLVQETNFVQVGKRLGVTDNAIRKRLKRLKDE